MGFADFKVAAAQAEEDAKKKEAAAKKKKLQTIAAAQAEFKAAEKAKNEAAMNAAHAKADAARGYSTSTREANGKLYQVQSSVAQKLPVAQAQRGIPVAVKTPVLPKVTPQNFRNATSLTKVDPAQQSKNTQTFLGELKSNQGNVAALAAGFGTGLVGGGKRYLAPETKKVIESNQSLNRAFTGGQVVGSLPGFAAPYGAASKGVGTVVSKLPVVKNMGKLGQTVAKSVATDLAVGLPLNVNLVFFSGIILIICANRVCIIGLFLLELRRVVLRLVVLLFLRLCQSVLL